MMSRLLKCAALAFTSLVVCSCTKGISISCDAEVDGTYYDARCDRNYYITDGTQKILLGTYSVEPVLYKFDFAELVVSGDKSTHVHLVTRENGEIQLTYLIPQVYELHPESRPFVLFAEDVSQTPTGDIAITFYSPSEEVEFVVCVDREMKVRMLD